MKETKYSTRFKNVPRVPQISLASCQNAAGGQRAWLWWTWSILNAPYKSKLIPHKAGQGQSHG